MAEANNRLREFDFDGFIDNLVNMERASEGLDEESQQCCADIAKDSLRRLDTRGLEELEIAIMVRRSENFENYDECLNLALCSAEGFRRKVLAEKAYKVLVSETGIDPKELSYVLSGGYESGDGDIYHHDGVPYVKFVIEKNRFSDLGAFCDALRGIDRGVYVWNMSSSSYVTIAITLDYIMYKEGLDLDGESKEELPAEGADGSVVETSVDESAGRVKSATDGYVFWR